MSARVAVPSVLLFSSCVQHAERLGMFCLKGSISIGYRQNEIFFLKTPLVLTSLVLRTLEYFIQVIHHLTDQHTILVSDILSPVMSVPGVHSAAGVFFFFRGLTMALKVSIFADVLKPFHSISYLCSGA